jgi:hypothetical protein
MSAREDPYAGLGPAAVGLLHVGGQDVPVTYDEIREAMDAYRAEVLREAAEEIRRWADAAEGCLFDEERCGALDAADHIDPDIDDRRSVAP